WCINSANSSRGRYQKTRLRPPSGQAVRYLHSVGEWLLAPVIQASHTSMMLFDTLVALVGILAGGIASIAGFGIGSLLTPLFAYRVGTKIAVAAVSVPHFAATLYRFWLLRKGVDRRTLINFGITSAAGGLVGALLNAHSSNPALTILFGAILIFVALSEFTGLAQRMRFSGPMAWLAGGVSGLLGGLVGNQ